MAASHAAFSAPLYSVLSAKVGEPTFLLPSYALMSLLSLGGGGSFPTSSTLCFFYVLPAFL